MNPGAFYIGVTNNTKPRSRGDEPKLAVGLAVLGDKTPLTRG